MSTASSLRRVAVSVLALGAALLSGGVAPVGAATTPTPSIPGQVLISGGKVTSTCDAYGRITSRTFTAAYDATRLTAPVYAGVGEGTYDPVTGFSTFSAGPTTTTLLRQGAQAQLTDTITSPRPVSPSSTVDFFSVNVYDQFSQQSRTVMSVFAVRQCGEVDAPASPTVTASAPRCDGTVDVTIDATGTADAWTPRLRLGDRTVTEPVVHPGEVVTRTVDAANLRAARLDVTFETPSVFAGYPQVSHGTTAGVSVPTCTASTRGAIVPITPARVLDTRAGTGAPRSAVAANGRVVVAAPPVVPAGATAVALNLTVTQPQAAGYLQAWSSLAGPGTASVLNFGAGQTIARSVIVPLDTLRHFAVANVSPGTAQLVADVTGYAVGDGAPGAGDLVPLEATRLLDTRTAGARVPVAPGATVHVPVVGRAGIGAASTVALQVTAVGGTSSGYLTTWSGTGTRPATSSVNYLPGQVVGALAPTAVAADGTVAVTNTSPGTVHLLVDVEGWWRGGSDVTTGGLRTVTPQRLLDTRTTGGVLVPGASLDVDVLSNVPAGGHLHGVSAVLINLTATRPTSSGYLRAQPQGTPAAPSSTLNFEAGRTVANQALVGVSDSGRITVTNGSFGATEVLVDLVAYITR
ncbi:hypothetical protein [Lapillicoccus jejuensis]|uniref:Uncharacterized protein n=1 Tax=Lapillicoccus jejuensis TaxID=402171 RepID=A0A542E347_9MICO|nr:hypothetical protein [Lapillicoccus jejuensis]TQJ09760.1 hypothetical protein FB458_2874 [Lapillicoccus jejuensis]